MHKSIIHFIKYNNAFTIIFVVVFFGFGISYAASPAVREGVYSSEETVVSVDNNLIISTDLDNFHFNLRINSITEDEKNYYAVYSYQTLAVEDGFWQGKDVEKTLTVNKEALGGRDLGLYVAEELGENINYELAYLKRVQQSEKEKGESRKTVAVEYSGLIGKLLDPEEKVIEGYSPVIPEPAPEVPAIVESNPAEVIVSTPYSQPLPEDAAELQAEPAMGAPESQAESAQEPISDSAAGSPQTDSTPIQTPLPAPEEMVDEELVQEVVEILLRDQATSTPASEQQAEPAQEPASTPAPEPVAPAPEAGAESAQEPVPAPTPPQDQPTPIPPMPAESENVVPAESAGETPAPEAAPEPEAVSEPEQ